MDIELYGSTKYIPNNDWHLIGDGAFPLRQWLMTPYRNITNITREHKYHNFKLSADRIHIEHTFGILKGRWRRLQFVNTYSVSKAIEIATAACVLHNFCYFKHDEWNGDIYGFDEKTFEQNQETQRDLRMLGEIKRDRICMYLNNK